MSGAAAAVSENIERFDELPFEFRYLIMQMVGFYPQYREPYVSLTVAHLKGLDYVTKLKFLKNGREADLLLPCIHLQMQRLANAGRLCDQIIKRGESWLEEN